MNLQDYSDEQLKAELKKREATPKSIPVKLEKIDFEPVVEMIDRIIERAKSKRYWDEDYEGYIFEAVVKAIYGESFFDWLNSIN